MKPNVFTLAILSFMLGGTAQASTASCPAGFSLLQDGETCVRVSGRVRADTVVTSGATRRADSVRSQASGRVQLDVRRQTGYGPMRAVIRVDGLR